MRKGYVSFALVFWVGIKASMAAAAAAHVQFVFGQENIRSLL